MNGYSYNEIQNMQQKAIERVREMKRTSDAVVQTAQKEFNISENSKRQSSSAATPKVTNMPPNFPQDNIYPSFKDFFQEKSQSKQKPATQALKVNKKDNNSLENLFAEPDKALLLGLIMLLKSEGADESLIMALTYIMT